MKKVLSFLIVFMALAAAVFAAGNSKTGANKNELASSGMRQVEFINYTGKHNEVDSVDAIKGIGTELGSAVVPTKSGTLGSKDRYAVVHVVDAEEKEKLDADVFYIGKKATVDHITNVRRIVSAYLSAAYSYSEKEADEIASLITVYNAVYRKKYSTFKSAYKNAVVKNLSRSRCGLSTKYKDWPGKTEMVIPLSVNGKKVRVDTSVLKDEKVANYVKEGEKKKIRYKGLAFGAYGKAAFATGDWADYVTAAIGGGGGVEYTLPLNLSALDVGFSLRGECLALLPKSGGVVKSGLDFSVLPGVFVRIPFLVGSATAAFQPELSYGVVIHSINSDNTDMVESLYTDQVLCFSAGFRLSIPKAEKLEIELAPQCSAIFEKSDVIFQPGLRLGAVWHLAMK